MSETTNRAQRRIFQTLTNPMYGMNPAFYGSDIFGMLALILAWYEVGGNPPEKMIASEQLRALVAHHVDEANETAKAKVAS